MLDGCEPGMAEDLKLLIEQSEKDHLKAIGELQTEVDRLGFEVCGLEQDKKDLQARIEYMKTDDSGTFDGDDSPVVMLAAENDRLRSEVARLRGDGWISVDERLPDYDVFVIWLTHDINQYIDHIDKDGSVYWSRLFKQKRITHWHPLPDLPK